MLKCQQQGEGLPNLRNTCFLNSCLQCLFSSKVIYNKLKFIKHKSFFQQTIWQIFEGIKMKSDQKKISGLKKLIKYMQISQMRLIKMQQQDAIKYMFAIIEYLDPHLKSFQKLFEAEYHTKCYNINCPSHQQKFPFIFRTFNFTQIEQKCFVCNINCQIILHKIPQIIVILNQKQTNNQGFLLLDNKKQQHFYGFKSKINYWGNNRSGHYYAIRLLLNQKQNIFYQFNDNYVIPYQDYYRVYQKTKISLYQLVQDSQKLVQNIQDRSDFRNYQSNNKITQLVKQKIPYSNIDKFQKIQKQNQSEYATERQLNSAMNHNNQKASEIFITDVKNITTFEKPLTTNKKRRLKNQILKQSQPKIQQQKGFSLFRIIKNIFFSCFTFERYLTQEQNKKRKRMKEQIIEQQAKKQQFQQKYKINLKTKYQTQDYKNISQNKEQNKIQTIEIEQFSQNEKNQQKNQQQIKIRSEKQAKNKSKDLKEKQKVYIIEKAKINNQLYENIGIRFFINKPQKIQVLPQKEVAKYKMLLNKSKQSQLQLYEQELCYFQYLSHAFSSQLIQQYQLKKLIQKQRFDLKRKMKQ